jgi:L-threonylcarbamoyladenylate synthase
MNSETLSGALKEQFGVTEQQLRDAATLLREGKLVAFPTETVYGLGANALDFLAVSQIFAAKGRPRSSPLIVHVASIQMARELAAEWPESAQQLAERFWPGPLTIVVKKQPSIPDIVTAGLPTVGLRMPAHPVALALLREAGIPVAAPSANRFTQLSPTTADHVRHGLGRKVGCILEGGPCEVGIESTVLSVAEKPAVIFRPGGISRSEIESVIGPVAIHGEPTAAAHPSPGLHPQHYSPKTPLVLVVGGAVPSEGRGAYLQLYSQPARDAQVVPMPANPREYAARLYAILHDLDDQGYDWIGVETPEQTSGWEGVLDRLQRAAARGRPAQ